MCGLYLKVNGSHIVVCRLRIEERVIQFSIAVDVSVSRFVRKRDIQVGRGQEHLLVSS